MFTNKFKQNLPKNIKVGVFFDGTGNNANNLVSQGEQDDYKFTNIYRLFNSYGNSDEPSNEKSECLKIYVEGVGTKNGEKDNILVEASGIDFLTNVGWGVFSKFNDSVDRVADEIKKNLNLVNSDNNKLVIEFDVFGFSRGAAIARHFVNEITDIGGESFKFLQNVVSECGYELSDSPKINFLGLFDTVATVWTFSDALWSDPHDSGSTNGLKVNLPENIAENVFQITAMHECRYNYPLSSLQGHYPELALAGCHSDIGGNMPSETEETSLITNVYFKHPFFESAYDCVLDEISEIRKSKIWNELLSKYIVEGDEFYDIYQQGASIRNVKGDLQYVSLLVMYECARKSGCLFDGQIPKKYTGKLIGPLFRYFVDAINNMVTVTSGGESSLSQSLIDNITDEYIHISPSWQTIIGGYLNSEVDNSDIKPVGEKKVGCIFGNIWPDRPDSNWSRKVFLNNQPL